MLLNGRHALKTIFEAAIVWQSCEKQAVGPQYTRHLAHRKHWMVKILQSLQRHHQIERLRHER